MTTAVNSLAGLSLLALLLVAKAVELYYDQFLQLELTRESVLDQALHQPWWSLSSQNGHRTPAGVGMP